FKGIGPVSNFIFLLDFADWGLGGQGDPELGARGGSFWKKVNLGLEMPMGRLFALRTGFRQGNFSLGMGLNLKYLKLDLAWWGEELGHKVGTRTERRIGMRLVLGGGDLGPGAITENSLAEYRRRMRDTERAQDEAEKSQGLIEHVQKKGAAKELVDRLEEAGGTPPAEGTEPPASGGGAPEQGGTPSEGSGAESDSGQTESGDETGESP